MQQCLSAAVPGPSLAPTRLLREQEQQQILAASTDASWLHWKPQDAQRDHACGERCKEYPAVLGGFCT